jgi:serine/threonine protein kinase/tetratricopeptide (TPR) repeat protein
MTTVFHHVGPFEIVGQIGHGGMAQVFLADDTRHGRRVALKLVQLRDDRQGRDILEAERRGAQLQGRLSEVCPLVPRLYDDGDLPPYYFIAMEFVAGEDLSSVIARGPLKTDEAVAVARQLCQFLEAAHALETTIDGVAFRSLVHGDLKPGNVRISTSGEVKVLDFGIAKALSLSRKVTRNEFGSLPYMSPERLDSDAQEIGRPADLWALGVILYEMLSGAAPFHATDTRRLECQIRAGYHARPLPETVPVGLRAITARLLAPVPGGRYDSATSMLEDLQTFSNGETTTAEQQGFSRQPDEAVTRRTRPAAADEATRRMSAAAIPSLIPPLIPPLIDDATRRTRPAPAPPEATVTSLPKAPPVPSKRAWRLPSLRAVLLFLAFVIVANEVAVGSSARRLAAVAGTRDLDGITSIWDEYGRLSGRSFLHVGVIGLQRSLRARVLDLSEQVMANYRTPLPTVRERQWKAAQTNLQQALALSPGDARLRGDLRYCEGHLHRIDGEAEKLRNHRAAASQHFADAVTAFREAAELRPSWPDPFLGLARTFIYGLEDTDRAADALKQAQQRGHAIGDRETAQLGDGYRVRGDSLRQTARRLANLPQEAEYLQRAIAAYRAALAQYEQIAGYPGVATSLQRVHAIVDSLENRAAELAAEKDRAEQAGRWE